MDRGNSPQDKTEALLEMMAAFATESSPRGDASSPPAQIHIQQCPDCAAAVIPTGKGELAIGTAELERAQCDSLVSRPHQRNKASIGPAVRRQVLAKYRHKCQGSCCEHTRYLEIHHKTPRAQGGSNDLENLICLCSGCHGLIHRKRGFFVKAPAAVYQYRR